VTKASEPPKNSPTDKAVNAYGESQLTTTAAAAKEPSPGYPEIIVHATANPNSRNDGNNNNLYPSD